MDDLTTTIHTYLTTAPTSNFLQRPVEMGAHWEGSNNLLWRVECAGQSAVVKLYLDAGQARGRRQFDGQQLFSPLGLAPRPLWFDRHPTGLSRQVLIYEWLPGESVQTTNMAQMQALAQPMAQIHGGDASAVRRFCPNPLNLAYWWRVLEGGLGALSAWLLTHQATALHTQFTALAKQAQTLVEAALPLWQGVPPTPVHGDLKLENVIDTFGTAVLLDWEMFGLGDPAYEIATFLQTSQHQWAADEQADWLETYLANVDQPALAQQIALYQRLLPFESVCYLLHGLRQHAAADLPLLRESQPFLASTLSRALQQSAAALYIELAPIDQPIDELFRTVLHQPTDPRTT